MHNTHCTACDESCTPVEADSGGKSRAVAVFADGQRAATIPCRHQYQPLARELPPSLDPNRIVVADLANDTGDSTLSGVGALAGDIIAAGLTTDSALTIVNATVALPSHLQVNLPSADSTLTRATRDLVEVTHAGVAVTGAYFRTGKELQIVAEITDTRTDRVLGVAGPVLATTERPDSSLRVLRDSVVAIVKRGR